MQINFPEYEEEVLQLDDLTIELLYDYQTIWTNDTVYFLEKLSDFKQKEDFFYLTNEDSILQVTQEQYNIIKEFFIQKGRKLE